MPDALKATPNSPALLADDEPAPFERFNPGGAAPVLLLCDHASNFVPRALQGLGLDDAHLVRHIAWDIGAAEATREMARLLDAPALLSGFSRLVVDPNRIAEGTDLIPEVSDGVEVPGNRGLTPAQRQQRYETFHQVYHRTIEAELDALAARGPGPAVVSVHSFTPVMEGQERPWQVGILWNRDRRLPVPLMTRLRAEGLVVGDNEPYTGRDFHGYTLHSHAEPRRLANVLIELRQDLVDTHHGAVEWAGRMAKALQPILADPELFAQGDT